MLIKDEIYGTIEFNELEQRIIDSNDFQRLRRIKQMAFTYLVYPGATHTRFEHCLGTCHLATTICERLDIHNEEKQKIRLFALLHDVGHVAFSHESEPVLKKYFESHEEIGRRKIAKGEIADIINENYSTKKILELEKTKEGKIVTSDLGADRMDYLKRDAQNTGVAYGIIDVDRIVHTLAMHNNELCIYERGLSAAESLLIARFMMFSTVYFHKTVRIAAAMLRKAIKLSIEDGAIEPEDFLSLGDEEMLLKMKGSKNGGRYATALSERRLYKEAYSVEMAKEQDIEALEGRLSKKTGCDVIIDYPHDFFKPVEFKVKTEEGLVEITKISDLISVLKGSEQKRKKMLILCEEKDRKKVADVAKLEL